jgi:signal transduction histidine kinase
MIHSGSRGLGHQTCQDYVAVMSQAMARYGIVVPDRQLACAPVDSPEGQAYLGAIAAAANYGRANRQLLAEVVRDAFAAAVGTRDLVLVYDISHNPAWLEYHDVGGLVADVAHEVRTPLSVLQGEIEALQDGVASADPQHLASLHEEVVRLARLLDDLDAIAAAEAAGLGLQVETLDLAEVVASAQAGIDDKLRAQAAHLDAHLSPVVVRGDRRRLEQIVRNLLTNAARFCSPGGKVSITVISDGPDAVLEVTDDGPGIERDELPHVFERFWRGRQAHGTSGSGIGLAVVAELTAAHGGQVTAGNAPGRGARFTVRVPAA